MIKIFKMPKYDKTQYDKHLGIFYHMALSNMIKNKIYASYPASQAALPPTGRQVKISKTVIFFPKNEHLPDPKPEVLHKILKTVLPINPDSQLHQIFKPIRKLFCTFLYQCCCYNPIPPPLNIAKNKKHWKHPAG